SLRAAAAAVRVAAVAAARVRTAAALAHCGAAIGAASHAALAAGLACLFGRELVRGAFLVRCAAAFAGDLPLPLRVHGGEATVGFAALVALIVGSHDEDLLAS